MSEYVYPPIKISLVITYTIWNLRVVTSGRKYMAYIKTNLSYDFLCNGKDVVTITYYQSYTKIGRTSVYTPSPSIFGKVIDINILFGYEVCFVSYTVTVIYWCRTRRSWTLGRVETGQ